jgi:hypothetical protein
MKIVAGIVAAFIAANVIATVSGPVCIIIGVLVIANL